MLAGQVLAKISADTSGLKRGVNEANSQLRSLASTASQVGAKTAASMSGAEKALAQLSKSASSAKSTFVGFAAATGVMRFFSQTISAAKSAMIDFNSTLEQATIGFTTMMGSATAANRYLSQLKDFAAKTPFQFQELVGASQRLMALGFSAQAVQPMLRNVGDTVAALGGTMDYQGQIIIRALGQMQAKGKVSAEEMMQLSEAGISAWQYLADGYNVTTAEMMERTKKTVVDSGSAVQMIMDGMAADFGGMMEAQSKTLNGAFSTVIDYATQTVADATRPMYDKLRDGILSLAEVLSSPKFREGATKVADFFNKEFTNAFRAIGRVIDATRPAVDRLMQSLRGSGSNAWQGMKDALTAIMNALTNALPVAIEFAATMAELAPSIAVPALEAAVTVLGAMTDLFNENETAIRLILSLMLAKQVMSWVQSFSAFTTGLYATARAHIVAATAARNQMVAVTELATATQRANAAASIGFKGGVVPGLDAVNSRISTNAAAGMTMAQKSTNALKSALGGVAAMINPVTIGITAITVGLAAWSANTTQVQKATDELVASVTDGLDTLEDKYYALEVAKRAGLPSNEDIMFSGGAMSDAGAYLKQFGNFINPWGDDFGNAHSGADSSTLALDKMNEEQKKILDEYVLSQKVRLGQANDNALQWADEQIMAYAKAKDGIGNALKDMVNDQNEKFQEMANPMQEFADQSGISLETMMANMDSNATALLSWQENLMYFLQHGGEDIAAYFANLGPMSAQALSELAHSSPDQLEEFRRNMATEFALTGQESEAALNEGLSKIPDLAERAGIDMNAMLNEQVDAAMKKPVELTHEYLSAFVEIKKGAESNIADTFGEMALTSAETQKKIEELATAFNNLNPQDLVGAGLTPEALGIPEVQRALGELALEGEDNPITIAAAAEDALEDIGATQEQIDALVQTPQNIQLGVDALKKQESQDALDNIHDKLTNLTIGDWHVGVVLDVIGNMVGNMWTSRTSTSPQNGGSRTAHADGAFLPDQAMVQRGRTLVQWAEPETGGEAFIPLGKNKRGRSIDIWRQVGKEFGLLKFAGGGVLGGNAPAPWAFNGSGGGGGSSSSGGGGGGGGMFLPSIDLLKNLNELGKFTDGQLLKVFEDYLKVLPEFSDEWMSTYRDMMSLQEKMADDAQKIADENARRTQEMYDKIAEIQNNQYTMGAIDAQRYLEILNERLAATQMFSDDWMAIWQQIQSVTADMNAQIAADIIAGATDIQSALGMLTNAAGATRDALVGLLTNAYKVGDMTQDDYVAMLSGQLDQYQKYSDEWTSITLELQGIEEQRAAEAERAAQEAARAQEEAARAAEQAAREQERIMQEQQRAAEQYQRAYDSLQKSIANAIKQSFDSIVNPIKQATSLINAFGSEANVTFDQVQGFYEHMTDGVERWKASLDKLSSMGLNDSMMRTLLEQGPQSLGFAESLVAMGSSGIDYINTQEAALANTANSIGTQYMADAVIQGNQVIVGDVTIEIPPEFLNNTYPDTGTVYSIIEGAMGTLATKIRTGAGG